MKLNKCLNNEWNNIYVFILFCENWVIWFIFFQIVSTYLHPSMHLFSVRARPAQRGGEHAGQVTGHHRALRTLHYYYKQNEYGEFCGSLTRIDSLPQRHIVFRVKSAEVFTYRCHIEIKCKLDIVVISVKSLSVPKLRLWILCFSAVPSCPLRKCPK